MRQSNYPTDLLARGFLECKSITRRYGTSYFFATQFFPEETRKAIYAIYAFARIPDEIVDDPNSGGKADVIAKLDKWRLDWVVAMDEGWSDDPVLAAIVHTFKKYQIPRSEGEAFLRSMFMDEERSSYENYDELTEYMYGSAGVIGLMVTRIIGFSSNSAFQYALKLGYAFQLTNFLRDIREDAEDLGRIYMPRDEMQRFSLRERDILEKKIDQRFVDFMKFQISRNKQIYREALPGIDLLNWKGRFAVRISYVLYKAILTEIEKSNYDVYSHRARTNFTQKLMLSLKALVGIYE
ncbi:MAG: phytoene/squalene synthase family protein [Pyrinomonadaceae bacterium]|nr:phytoene/squalene synthase family protein [Pyrinomonadaceae bacterium]